MQANANAQDIDRLYDTLGDQIVFQITIPEFDLTDEKAAVAAARSYVDRYCQPGKPTMLIGRDALTCRAFAEEVYSYSRKHYLSL